jgi:hypothetical protein
MMLDCWLTALLHVCDYSKRENTRPGDGGDFCIYPWIYGLTHLSRVHYYRDCGFRRQVFEGIFFLDHGRNERGRKVRPH